jgi:Tfp pilus assembly protein PilO
MGKFNITFTFPINYYAPANTAKEELEALKDYVAQARQQLPQDSEIQNLVDEVASLINDALFLMRFE